MHQKSPSFQIQILVLSACKHFSSQFSLWLQSYLCGVLNSYSMDAVAFLWCALVLQSEFVVSVLCSECFSFPRFSICNLPDLSRSVSPQSSLIGRVFLFAHQPFKPNELIIVKIASPRQPNCINK